MPPLFSLHFLTSWRKQEQAPHHEHTKRKLPANFTQNKIRWGCEIKYAKTTMCTESKTVPNVGKIRGQKLWYIRRHRPVPCPAADCFFPKQMLPGSRSLPGSESLHLPSGSAFTSARCGHCPTRNFAHHWITVDLTWAHQSFQCGKTQGMQWHWCNVDTTSPP